MPRPSTPGLLLSGELQVLSCSYSVLLFQPTVQNSMGTLNNVIKVKNTDFEVFEALALDSQVTDNRRKRKFLMASVLQRTLGIN